MPERIMLSVQATPDVANIRTATLFDEEHTIVPCVALVEGVLWPANAPAPELALAEEFGRFPDGWNGRPVVFDHPKINGMAVSASHPEVMEEVAFGSIFNTTLEDDKLKVEIWINNERVESMSDEVQDAVKRLKDGDEVVEVSTGLFVMSEEVEGKFDGEDFSSIWRNIVPDHLAILPEGIVGACSVEDGCGAPRSNKVRGPDGNITSFTGEALHVNNNGERFEPVMNSSRIEFKTSDGTCACDDVTDNEKKGTFQKLMENVGNIFAFRDSAKNMSDNDVRTAINGALATTESFFWIMAVFDNGDGTGNVVFESFDEGKLFQQEFTITDNSVKLGADKVEVRPITEFVPVTVEVDEPETNANQLQENSTMDKDQLVQGLIDNESSQFTEDDRDFLAGLEESQLAKMSPVDNAGAADNDDGDGTVVNIGTVIGEVTDDNDDDAPVTTEDYIDNAPDEVKEVLNSGLKMHRARKKAIVDGLLANTRCTFSADQLNSKDLQELESLNELSSEPVTFEGSAPLRDNSENDDSAPAPLQIFDLSKSA